MKMHLTLPRMTFSVHSNSAPDTQLAQFRRSTHFSGSPQADNNIDNNNAHLRDEEDETAAILL